MGPGLGPGLGPRCTGVVAERRPGYSETSPCRLWINKGNGKHRPRGCGPQKSRTLLQPKTQGSFRCPPTGIHPCNNALRSPRILLILKSDGVFGTHSSIVMQVRGEAPMMFTSSGETPSKPNRQKFVVFLVKDKGAPRWCRRSKSTFASIRCRKT